MTHARWSATVVALGAATFTLACGGSGGSTPAATKEAKADAKAPDAKAPEAKAPDAKAPEANTPDTKAPEADPAQAEPSAKLHPRLDVAPSPDLAIVITQAGIVALDATGKTVGVLSSEKPASCRVDPRAGALWMHRGVASGAADTFQLGQLAVLDLEREGPPTTVLPRAPEVFVIAYANEELGRPEPHTFQDGVIVHMSEPPRAEALLGCDGDMSWICFPDEPEDEDAARASLLATLTKTISEQALATEALATLVTRGKTRRATLPDPGRAPAPRTLPVPSENCSEIPEDCGNAKILPGTRYWQVVVGNSRGDFYHEDLALYDPKTDELFDPTDSTARRKPSAEPQESSFTPEWISPSGELALGENMLVRLEGGVVARDLEGVCGFWGGGWTL